jgi:type IV pilus assembly protein PilQ
MEERMVTDQPQTLKVPTGPFASNTPITLDLRDTELRDVFRLLAAQLKKNIVIHDTLPPILVSMTYKNEPLSNVFGYLMKTYDIAYEIVGKDTIVVGTAAGLARLSGKEETRAYRIAYAEPAALSTLLPRLTKIGDSNLVVDDRLRTVYATGTPDVLEEVAIAIQKLDHPGKQVMLHARILQFNKGDSLQVENALNAVYDHWALGYSNGALSGVYADDNRRGRPGTIPNTIDRGRIMPPGLDSIRTPLEGTWREFDASFRALEEKTHTKTLANPSVITIDGVEASISLTEDYPYISGRDDAGNPTWSNITVGPVLKMTPRVGRGNNGEKIVTLNLDLQTSDRIGFVIGSTGEQMPQTSRRQVVTNVRVRDGEPFVVGGLFREDKTNNKMRIPVLGQLPLLGEIFTHNVKNKSTTQVVMVVVPYVLDTPDIGVEQERVMIKQ